MRITFITTVNHNPGDDFVRAGIIYLLRKKYKKFVIQLIHKHWPITVMKNFDWLHRSGITTKLEEFGLTGYRVSKVLDIIPNLDSFDKIMNSDILVQSGAPLYWINSSSSSANIGWYEPLIIKRFLMVKEKTSLLNLAAGSCQHYSSNGSEFLTDQPTVDFIKEFYHLSKVTTVRDRLIFNVFQKIGLEAPLLPCTSIFAKDLFNIPASGPEYAVLNFMEVGGHYDFKKNIKKNIWADIFKSVYEHISKENKCLFVCHSTKEVEGLKKFLPNVPVFYSTDWKDYLKVYSKAKFGIMNRIHGAMALASFGIPSVVVGNDTRVQMGDLLGIKSIFINDATCDLILDEVKRFSFDEYNFTERMDLIRKNTFENYMSLLETI